MYDSDKVGPEWTEYTLVQVYDRKISDKNGKSYWPCEWALGHTGTGEVLKITMFEGDMKFLKASEPAELLNKVLYLRRVGKFINYKLAPQGSEPDPANPPPMSNYMANKREIAQRISLKGHEDKELLKSIEIGLRGLMQSHIIAGRDNAMALTLAQEADEMVRKAARDQHQGVSNVTSEDLPF